MNKIWIAGLLCASFTLQASEGSGPQTDVQDLAQIATLRLVGVLCTRAQQEGKLNVAVHLGTKYLGRDWCRWIPLYAGLGFDQGVCLPSPAREKFFEEMNDRMEEKRQSIIHDIEQNHRLAPVNKNPLLAFLRDNRVTLP
jgi:hypothetical protein